jgi:hypothetical protein
MERSAEGRQAGRRVAPRSLHRQSPLQRSGDCHRWRSCRWQWGGGALLLALLVGLTQVDWRVARASGSANDQEEILPVARVSFLNGVVRHQRRRDSTTDWDQGVINLPVEESDQLKTEEGARLEIEWGGRIVLRLASKTHLQIDRFRPQEIELGLPSGTLSLSYGANHSSSPSLQDQKKDPPAALPTSLEISTPLAAVTILEEGEYRVTVDEGRRLVVTVRRGRAEVYRQELGTLTIAGGRRLVVSGEAPPSLELGEAPDPDEWDRWSQRRDEEIFARGDVPLSLRYLEPESWAQGGEQRDLQAASGGTAQSLAGVADLDRYGTWEQVGAYGWGWTPRFVGIGWAPYRLGDWRWYGARGWTWVSYEPWGWLPYHYGRWAWYQSRWFWVPRANIGPGWSGGPYGLGWRWYPHQVAFFGWGDAYRVGYRDGFRDGSWTLDRGQRGQRGWIGWCPLAPGESLGDPSRKQSPRTIAQLRNYTIPGGVSGLDRQRFTEGRVIEIRDRLQVPPQGQRVGRGGTPTLSLLTKEELRPHLPRSSSRTSLLDRGDVAGRLARPEPTLIRRADGMRRTALPPARPRLESRDISPEGTRIERGVVVRPTIPSRSSLPARGGEIIERRDGTEPYTSSPRLDSRDLPRRTTSRPESRPTRPVDSPPSRIYLPRTSTDSNRRPPASRPAPPVSRPAPPVSRPAPPVSRPAPPVSRPAPPVSRPAPPVSRPAPPVSRPAPPASRPAPAPRVIERSTPLPRSSPPPVRESPSSPSRPERPSRSDRPSS